MTLDDIIMELSMLRYRVGGHAEVRADNRQITEIRLMKLLKRPAGKAMFHEVDVVDIEVTYDSGGTNNRKAS